MESEVRLNPDAEALLGYTAAVDSFTQSLVRFGHLMAPQQGLDADFVAEVKATAETVMKRFRHEVQQSMSLVVSKDKQVHIIDPGTWIKQ